MGKESPTLGPLPLIFLPDLVTKSLLWYKAGWELGGLLETSKQNKNKLFYKNKSREHSFTDPINLKS